MTKHKKFSARILSLALSVAMVTTMLPMTVFAAEGDASIDASAIGVIQSFDKLGDRFIPSVGTDAPSHVYGLSVALNTPVEDLDLPDELTAMVARTTTVSAPAEDEAIPDEDKVVDEDTSTDDTVSGNQPASPSDAEEEVKEEIKDEDVPLAPEPEQDEETIATTVKQETIPVTWNSDKEYKSDENGKFIYTAELPEGYNLADGVKLPQIYVFVGRQARDARVNAITVTINGSTTESGATLQAVVEANGGVAAVTGLKITAGEVTEDDWNYLKNLTALETFEIASTIADANVANIPDGINSETIFPSSIVSVTVPQAITIGSLAFYYCTELTSASFPAATSIGKSAFDECAALTSTSFPAATNIGDSAFLGCIALTSASFPAATIIDDNAFYNCTKLTSASFPVATSIGDNAFQYSTKLAALNLGATPPTTVGTSAFATRPTTRALGYVNASGIALTGTDLTNAQAAYKAVNDGDIADDLWYGWTIAAVESPTITIGTQPTSPAAMTYGSITGNLTVAGTASNNNTISYQWYKNTTNSATGGTTVTGATSASFTIPTTLDAGTYYYYCVLKATDCADKISNVATVIVSKTTVTIIADNKSAYVGDAKPLLTYNVTGLASGDTLATAPTLTYESEPDMSKAGSVKIKASGAVVPNTDNYESAITYVDGALTIRTKSTGGGGSSSGQAIWTSIPPQYNGGTKIIGNVRVPDYTVEGDWKKNENGTWTFTRNGGQTYANTWAPIYNPYADVKKGQSAFDWFMFDASGNMMTGWYTDGNGNTYYLNPNSDNTLGAMQTGWVLIDGKYYYFNEMPDGTRGKLFRNARTHDGYLVDENGVWDGSEKRIHAAGKENL